MEEPGQNGFQLMISLGYIVPWTLIASIGTGMLLPMGNFLALNFFAQKYTDLPPSEVQCQLSTQSEYCQLALIDGNRLLTVLAVVMPLCQFLTLPLVGVLSDAVGRRKAMIVVYFLSNIAVIFADLFVFFNFSFWFTIAWQPFMNTQVCTTVLNAACVDLLKPQDRAAGMGIITALDTIAYVIGLQLGMTCFFSLIVWYIGEVGAMAFGRLASTIYILVGVSLNRPTQAYINCSICAGPMTFALPAVAGLKSRLVGEEEQGRMQAAISTVFMVSGSLGSLLGGYLFEKLGNVDETGHFSQLSQLAHALVGVNLTGAFLSAILFYDLFQRTKHFIGNRVDTRRLSSEACPETSEYGSTI